MPCFGISADPKIIKLQEEFKHQQGKQHNVLIEFGDEF